jgi:hypothetical protein
MASKRRVTKQIIPSVAKSRKATGISHDEKLKVISKYKRVTDPTNKKSVAKQFAAVKSFPLHLQKKADKKQRAELKEHGFFTTEKGVIIDGPRSADRQPIKGTRFAIHKGGVVSFTNKKKTAKGEYIRRDYVAGFTAKEKKEFAKNPAAFMKKKEAELKKSLRGLMGKKKIQVRLQWGAYQATKDFHPAYFTKRYQELPARDFKRVKDRLTGMHIVVHERKRKTSSGGKKRGKSKKK